MENLLIHPTAPNGVRLINMDAISWDRPVGDFGNQHWLYEFGDGWSTAFSYVFPVRRFSVYLI
jgi:hypothetical protein